MFKEDFTMVEGKGRGFFGGEDDSSLLFFFLLLVILFGGGFGFGGRR